MKETFGFDNVELEDSDIEKKEQTQGATMKSTKDLPKNLRDDTQSDYGIFSRNGGATLDAKVNQL
jgi:hypothetical protein